MDVVNYTDFRKGLAKFLDKVDSDKSPLLITRQNAEPAVLMSLKEFNAYEETAYLLSSSKNAERLRRSVADAKAGRLVQHDITDQGSESISDDEVDA